MKKRRFFLLLVVTFAFSIQICRADTVAEALSGADCFQGLTESGLEAVAALGIAVKRNSGDRIITYGVPINRLFVLKTGQAEVILKTGVVVAVVGPGTTLGEMEFVDGHPASATVVVSEDAEMIEFDPEALRDLMQRQPSIGYRVMANMARKISRQLRARQ